MKSQVLPLLCDINRIQTGINRIKTYQNVSKRVLIVKKMDKKQTAVEWLVKELTPSITLQQKYIDELEKKAKEMEKEQIVNALNDGWNMAKHSNFVNSDAEQYYNETYKKE
jgi:hypothetical protein